MYFLQPVCRAMRKVSLSFHFFLIAPVSRSCAKEGSSGKKPLVTSNWAQFQVSNNKLSQVCFSLCDLGGAPPLFVSSINLEGLKSCTIGRKLGGKAMYMFIYGCDIMIFCG